MPFSYESTGIETHFTQGLDPEPRARAVFAFHRPETLADFLKNLPLSSVIHTGSAAPAMSASADTGDALKEKAIRSHTDRFAGVAIIDGRRTTIELLKSWPRGDIESIEVLKGAAAIAAYGSDAAEGVIILTTKKK